MDTSRESQLPEYQLQEYQWDMNDVPRYRVVCPRCSGEFWVGQVWFVLHPVEGRTDQAPAYPFGRMCPYCSRTSAIPASLRRRATPKRTTSRRRVVKRRKPR